MSDIVEANINKKVFGVLENTKNTNNAQEQEVNDLSQFLKFEYNKYIEYKIIYDILEECIYENKDVDRNLMSKVKDILLSSSVTQTRILDDSDLDECYGSLFGLSRKEDVKLNYAERDQLQELLKLKLDQKYRDLCSGLSKSPEKEFNKTFDSENQVPTQLSHDGKVLIDFKNKLLLEQQQYVKNLLDLQELLREVTDLRLNQLPQIAEQKIKEYQIEERMNNLKSLLAQEKVRVDIFMETNNSLKAYKELIKEIKEQQQDCAKEIENLKDLKEKYNSVSCKQYDDILKSYLQYKSSIKKKKLLYDYLKSE